MPELGSPTAAEEERDAPIRRHAALRRPRVLLRLLLRALGPRRLQLGSSRRAYLNDHRRNAREAFFFGPVAASVSIAAWLALEALRVHDEWVVFLAILGAVVLANLLFFSLVTMAVATALSPGPGRSPYLPLTAGWWICAILAVVGRYGDAPLLRVVGDAGVLLTIAAAAVVLLVRGTATILHRWRASP